MFALWCISQEPAAPPFKSNKTQSYMLMKKGQLYHLSHINSEFHNFRVSLLLCKAPPHTQVCWLSLCHLKGNLCMEDGFKILSLNSLSLNQISCVYNCFWLDP